MMKKSTLHRTVTATHMNGMTDIVIKSLTTGPLLTAYVLSFGVGNVMLGFLQAVVPLFCFLHVFVACFLERGVSPKKIACISSVLSRPFLLLMGIALLCQTKPFGFGLFACSYILFYILVAITGGAFWPWCKQLVPHRLMSAFFAQRLRYILSVKIIVVTGATLFLAFLSVAQPDWQTTIYAVFLFVAFGVGIFYTYTLFQMSDVQLKRCMDIPFRHKVIRVLKKKSFLSLLFKLGVGNFAFALFTPFSIAFLMKGLKLSVVDCMIYFILSSCTDIVFISFWKKRIQLNLSKVIAQSLLLMMSGSCVFACLACTPSVPVYMLLTIAAILTGIGSAGINLGISDASVSYVPHQMSSVYIAVVNIARFGFTALGTFLAGVTVEVLTRYTTNHWFYFFIMTSVIFVGSTLFVRQIKPVS